MAVRRRVRYSPLPAEDVDDGRDLRYEFTPKAFESVPWRSIALAVFLLLMGSALLLLALFVFVGHLEADQSQGFGLMVVGVLAFLPVGIAQIHPHIILRGWCKSFEDSTAPEHGECNNQLMSHCPLNRKSRKSIAFWALLAFKVVSMFQAWEGRSPMRGQLHGRCRMMKRKPAAFSSCPSTGPLFRRT